MSLFSTFASLISGDPTRETIFRRGNEHDMLAMVEMAVHS